jgi:hypothetical protein
MAGCACSRISIPSRRNSPFAWSNSNDPKRTRSESMVTLKLLNKIHLPNGKRFDP